MRTLQRTITCPGCQNPSTLIQVVYLTGPRAGEREFELRCANRHSITQGELHELWGADADNRPECE